MDLTMYPYGNGRQLGPDSDGQYTFKCQHGDSECVGNLIEACAIQYHSSTGDMNEWFPFIYCVEKTAGDEGTSPAKAAPACAKQVSWDDYDSNIRPCAQGTEGNALMHKIADATDGLSPSHTYVPWPVMNGKPLTESQMDQSLVKLVCNAYTGSDKPAACSSRIQLDRRNATFA